MFKKTVVFTGLLLLIILSSAILPCFAYGWLGGYEQTTYHMKGETYNNVAMPNTYFWDLTFNGAYSSDQSKYFDAKDELLHSLNALPDIEYAGFTTPEVSDFNIHLTGQMNGDVSTYVVSEFYAKMHGVSGIDGDSSVFQKKYEIDEIIPVVISGGYSNTQEFSLNQKLEAELQYSDSVPGKIDDIKKYHITLQVVGFMKPPYSLGLPLNSSFHVCFILPEIQYDAIKFPHRDIRNQTQVGIKYKDGDSIPQSEAIINKYGYVSAADNWEKSDDETIWTQAAYAVPGVLAGLVTVSAAIIVSLYLLIRHLSEWKQLVITIAYCVLTFIFSKYIFDIGFSKWSLSRIFGKDLDLSNPFIPIYVPQDKTTILLTQIIIAIGAAVILIILCRLFIKMLRKRKEGDLGD